MAFKDVYNAVFAQLEADATLQGYVGADEFVKGFKESLPAKKYMVILEPGNEDERTQRQTGDGYFEVDYQLQVYCRLLLTGSKIESAILGNDNYKGVLEFVDDVKAAIRKDMSFSYDTYGRSLSLENVAGSFDLSSSQRYLSVSIDGKTPTGYDAVNCGTSTLAGDAVAANIQASLRALGKYSDDGYKLATCTFNSSTNQFTISSSNVGPRSEVVVGVGASYDASSVLGFDSPTEYRGTNIVRTLIETVTVDNRAFPVRYRIVPLLVTEEIRLK
jgi:hypothetical protein